MYFLIGVGLFILGTAFGYYAAVKIASPEAWARFKQKKGIT